MRNTSNLLSSSFVAILFLALGFAPSAYADRCCNVREIKKHDKHVSDVLCDGKVGRIYLKYDPDRRRIWLQDEHKKINQTVFRLEKNANPELVGAEASIRFVPNELVRKEGGNYIGLIISERSMRGNGGGQCGAGSEEYFIAYKLNGTKLKEIHRTLIQSCIKDISLDSGDGNNSDRSVVFDEATVVFKWLFYTDKNGGATGRYNFHTNSLVID